MFKRKNSNGVKIVFAADHAGFELKEKLVPFVKELGFDVEDLGVYEYNKEDDYPDFIQKAAQAVSKQPDNVKAIILGGSGQGEAMVANRCSGVRAALYYGGSPDIVTLSREHNDANILSLAARFVSEEEATEAVKIWLNTSFSGDERHIRRIKKIDTYD